MTTVFRLPPEPPVGTTVEPVNGVGKRYIRIEDEESSWELAGQRHGGGPTYPWGSVLTRYPEGLVVVEPDPHPTPWRLDDWFGDHTTIFDANSDTAAYIECADRDLARRIVDAVNKAATP